MPESPGEAEILDRIVAEDPRRRAARRAYERWLTLARVKAAVERLGLAGEDRIRFVCASLWPTIASEHLEQFVDHAMAESAGVSFELPSRIEDVVDPRELELLAAFGYLPGPYEPVT